MKCMVDDIDVTRVCSRDGIDYTVLLSSPHNLNKYSLRWSNSHCLIINSKSKVAILHQTMPLFQTTNGKKTDNCVQYEISNYVFCIYNFTTTKKDKIAQHHIEISRKQSNIVIVRVIGWQSVLFYKILITVVFILLSITCWHIEADISIYKPHLLLTPHPVS
jgi:hypothetical protein